MYHPHVGDTLAMLDTPAMLVDLALMETNITALMGRLRKSHVQVRPP
ncbi:MAG: hypothetical protein ACRDHZ_12580 [Ktedonobacteraceae bacterium]